MPAIAIRCACGREYEVDAAHAAKILACAGCGRSIAIPATPLPRGRAPAAPCERHPEHTTTATVCSNCRAPLCAACIRAFGYYCSVTCNAVAKKQAPALTPTMSEVDVATAERGLRAARKLVAALLVLAATTALVALARWATREQGRELWRHDPSPAVALMPPGVWERRVACTTGSGELWVFEADGVLSSTLALGMATTYAAPLCSKDGVFVPLERGVARVDWGERPVLGARAVSPEGHRLCQPLIDDGTRAVAVTRAGTTSDGFFRATWVPLGAPSLVALKHGLDGRADAGVPPGTPEAPDPVPSPNARALPVHAARGRAVVALDLPEGSTAVEIRTAEDGPAVVVVAGEPGVSGGWPTARGVLLQASAGLLHVDAEGKTWRAAHAVHVGHTTSLVIARLESDHGARDDVPGPQLGWGEPSGPLVAIELSTGAERWRLPLPQVRALLAADEAHLALLEEAVYVATDRPSAREAAHAMSEALGGRWVAPPQTMLVVEASTGAVVRRITPGGHAAFFDQGRLLVLRVELDPGLVGERQHLRTHLAMHSLGSTGPSALWMLEVPGALVSSVVEGGRLYGLAGSQWPAPSLDDQAADGRFPPTSLVAIGWR